MVEGNGFVSRRRNPVTGSNPVLSSKMKKYITATARLADGGSWDIDISIGVLSESINATDLILKTFGDDTGPPIISVRIEEYNFYNDMDQSKFEDAINNITD